MTSEPQTDSRDGSPIRGQGDGATPPAIARWVLSAAAGAKRAPALIGDLDEEFLTHVLPDRGRRRARAWYRSQALRSLLPIMRRRLEAASESRRARGRGENLMHSMFQDLRFALRSLRKRPGFTFVVVLTLSLGIGATAAMYSIVDGLILNPFPFPDADRLVAVGSEYPRLGRELSFVEHMSPAEYIDIRDRSRTLESVVSWDMGNRQVSAGDAAENLFTGFWWGDGFEAVGMAPGTFASGRHRSPAHTPVESAGADLVEGEVQHRVLPPGSEVEVPPLGIVHGEPDALHHVPEELATPSLLRGPPRIIRVRPARELIVPTGHLDRLPRREVEEREVDRGSPIVS